MNWEVTVEMKRKGAAVLLLVVVGVLAFLVWSSGPNRAEPMYHGKYYTEWLEQFVENSGSPEGSSGADQVDEAREAMSQIGTNAVPALIELVTHKNSMSHQLVGTIVTSVSRKRTAWHRPDVKRRMVLLGFSALRAEPGPAVPALVALLSHERAEVRACAADALATLGPEARAAIPDLVALLDGGGSLDPLVTIGVMRALREIRESPEIVLPMLLKYVSGEKGGGGDFQGALSVFGEFGEQAAFMVPQLEAIRETAEDALLLKNLDQTLQAISGASADSNPAVE